MVTAAEAAADAAATAGHRSDDREVDGACVNNDDSPPTTMKTTSNNNVTTTTKEGVSAGVYSSLVWTRTMREWPLAIYRRLEFSGKRFPYFKNCKTKSESSLLFLRINCKKVFCAILV
jgi:hypothetical protein